MTKSIEITFGAAGEVRMEGHHFKGKECDAKMKEIEQALGAVTDRTDKPEYLQQTTGVTNGLKQRT